jgi:hypothetical protein
VPICNTYFCQKEFSMKLTRNLFCVCLALFTAVIPALAQTMITSPTNGEVVSSPFTLNMSASTCSSMPATAVGYSLDNSASTSSWPAQYIDGPVAAPGGSHTLHVKVWNGSGGVCVTDVSVNVDSTPAAGSSGSSSIVPSNAVEVSSIQALGDWVTIHDGGTTGSSSGTMSLTSSPSLTGNARLFANQLNDFGGQRYSIQFDDNTTSQNFFYDAWVYISGSAAGFSNLEFDLDQTMPNGQTVVMGFQCDSWIQRWDYAVNGGSIPMLPAPCKAGESTSGTTCRFTSPTMSPVGSPTTRYGSMESSRTWASRSSLDMPLAGLLRS